MQLAFNFSNTTKYAIILGLIAMSSLCSHYVTSQLIKTSLQTASIINEAGRQRMYSQRIASLAIQYTDGNKNTKEPLSITIAKFEQNHNSLINRMKSHVNGFSFVSHDHQHNPYTQKETALAIYNYLTLAKQVATLANTDPAIKPVTKALVDEANNHILSNLDNAVVWEQKHAEAHLSAINNAQNINFFIIITTLIIGVLGVFRPMVKNSSYLMNLANIDSLTGTLTRRAFSERAKNELNRAKRYHKPLSILAIDVDHFKNINDNYGHGGGDAALVALSGHIQQSLRHSDFLGRWGGEEFLILLCEANIEEASVVAERYRASLAEIKVPYGSESIMLTVSIGVAAYASATDTLEGLINQADNALYQAKNAGRNQVFSFEPKNIYSLNKVNRA